jgi:hypothetical protein
MDIGTTTNTRTDMPAVIEIGQTPRKSGKLRNQPFRQKAVREWRPSQAQDWLSQICPQ